MANDDAAAAERLTYQLRLIESIAGHVGKGQHDLAAPGSELDADDRALGAHQTSHLVGHCLSVSLDALQTARLILRDESTDGLRVPLMGQYPVLRTSIESTSLAIWLLAPDDQTERLRRSLSARMDEIHHDDHLVTVLTEEEPGDSKTERSHKQKQRRDNSARSRLQKRRIRGYAEAAGIPLEQINPGLPGFGPIVRESGATVGLSGNHTEGIWGYVSGLTHPSVRRSIAASDVERLADGEVFAASFTANLTTVAMAMNAAISGHLAALRILARRGGRPELEWSPEDGFPMPPWLARNDNRPHD